MDDLQPDHRAGYPPFQQERKARFLDRHCMDSYSSSLSTSVFVLLTSGVSYFAVAFLVRLPVNLIDKTVSLILALLVYFLAAKIRRLYSKRKE